VWVPDEVSVVGVNDDLHARLTEPPLTTVRLPIAEAGRKAAEIVLQSISQEPPRRCRESLPLELVRRASTGPPSST
jgi:DNA-binding LacI/PurR family transcriptional regulator